MGITEKAKKIGGQRRQNAARKQQFQCFTPLHSSSPGLFRADYFRSQRHKNQVRRARQSESFTQKFFAHIFQNISGALDPDFSRENRILILDAKNTFEAHVHVGLNDGLPEARAVAVADSSKSL